MVPLLTGKAGLGRVGIIESKVCTQGLGTRCRMEVMKKDELEEKVRDRGVGNEGQRERSWKRRSGREESETKVKRVT